MTQHYRKKLIEVALPLTVINDQSGKEKSKKVGKPSSIHMWWARRPFAACRAVLFAQLIDDPSAWPEKFPTLDTQKDERDKLFDIISSLVDWEKSTQPDTIYEARRALAKYTAWSNDDTPPVSRDEIDAYLIKNIPIVYDPFCGGGGIPLEAQRLGLRAWGSDLNPVAVTISKALVDFPEKFKSLPPMNPYSQNILQNSGVWNSKEVQGLCEDIEYYGKLAISGAFEEIGHLYPLIDLPEREGGGKADVISWIWARTVRSPNPAFNGAHVPLVKSFILSSGKKEQFYIDPIPNRETLIIEYNIRKGKPATDMKTVHRNGATCIFTGDAITFDYIENEGKAKRMGFTLMAIVAKGRTGRVYLERNEEQEKLII